MRQNGTALFRAASNGLSLTAYRFLAEFKHTIHRPQVRCFITLDGSTLRLKRPHQILHPISKTTLNHPFDVGGGISGAPPSCSPRASFTQRGIQNQSLAREARATKEALVTEQENTVSKFHDRRILFSSEEKSSLSNDATTRAVPSEKYKFEGQEPTSTNEPIAREERLEGGGIRLQMIIPAANKTLDTNLSAFYKEKSSLTIDINLMKNDAHTRYVTRRKLTMTPNPGEQSTAYTEWITALRRMTMMTPMPDQSWVDSELWGSEWVILELNHLILDTFRGRAIPFNREIARGAPSKLWVHMDRGDTGEIHLQLRNLMGEALQRKQLSEKEREILGPVNKCPLLPKSLSKSSFSRYIVELTGFREPGIVNTLGHPKYWIADILNCALFTCPLTVPFVSRVALFDAWKFLIQQRMGPEADELLARMKALGYDWNVEHSNFKLLALAQSNERFTFNKELTQMSHHQILPNNGTWAIMLLCASSHAFEHIVDVSKSHFITPKYRFAVEDVDKFISVSFGHFLASGRSVKDYLEMLNSAFGQDWMTKATSIAILNCLGESLRMPEAVEYLALVVASKRPIQSKAEAHNKADIGTACLHHLLGHCNRQTNADLAAWLVIYAAQNLNVRAEHHITFGLLFKVAWKARMYNLLRVVWRYAVFHGELNYEMRTLIFKSLQIRRQPPSETVRGRWAASYGVVCCDSDPVADSELTPDIILEEERKSMGKATPLHPFIWMIAQAVALDRAWSANMVKKSNTVEWMMENAIKIPLAAPSLKPVANYRGARRY